MQLFNLAIWSSTILAIAQAAPSPLQLDVSVNVKEGSSSLAQGAICLRVCWPETPTCPDGWYSNNMGVEDYPCWTCCKAPSISPTKPIQTVKQIAQAPKKQEVLVNYICLSVCWPETPTCPDSWYSNNFGTASDPCWTCCKAPSLLAAEHEMQVS